MDDVLIFGNFLGKSHYIIKRMLESEYLFYDRSNKCFKKDFGKYFNKKPIPKNILKYVSTDQAILFMLGEK